MIIKYFFLAKNRIKIFLKDLNNKTLIFNIPINFELKSFKILIKLYYLIKYKQLISINNIILWKNGSILWNNSNNYNNNTFETYNLQFQTINCIDFTISLFGGAKGYQNNNKNTHNSHRQPILQKSVTTSTSTSIQNAEKSKYFYLFIYLFKFIF